MMPPPWDPSSDLGLWASRFMGGLGFLVHGFKVVRNWGFGLGIWVSWTRPKLAG